MPQHRVIFADDELMDGQDWIVCNRRDDGVILFVRRGTRSYTDNQVATMLEEALTGYHNIMEKAWELPQRVSSSATAAS